MLWIARLVCLYMSNSSLEVCSQFLRFAQKTASVCLQRTFLQGCSMRLRNTDDAVAVKLLSLHASHLIQGFKSSAGSQNV